MSVDHGSDPHAHLTAVGRSEKTGFAVVKMSVNRTPSFNLYKCMYKYQNIVKAVSRTLLRDKRRPGRRLIAVEPLLYGLLSTTSSDTELTSALVALKRSKSGEFCLSLSKQSGPDIDLKYIPHLSFLI